ncbi:homoaconitate hydratase family protein [Stanieria cyanosphaera PCC 7437]|uniref:Homoaconitate hydratase family protein n=1 Tax=Stanieria cyanosphaera (strain ATCC 29371 / PCC 7437) TaxID=111780 RepID=K9Y0N2_STAC7|nr:aconitase/3-isopropylmalate dehydratase large subunit family protein [Stanieria cyanosphaera]AFZ37864.1 homoaconitate hydratase family protein [Stanieria cyanosphaera PCC 7437]
MNKFENILYLGDDINTDDIIPAKRGTNGDLEHLARYALEYLIGENKLKEYNIIEAGDNFGCGSSREYAPLAIKAAGIKKVRARSFAEIFYRNSINIGLNLEIIGENQNNSVIEAISQAGGLIAFNQQRLQGKVTIPPSHTKPRPMTIAEKLLAKASGNQYVQPGEVIFAKVDLAMSHDAIAFPVGQLFYQHFGQDAKVWDANRVVLVADHFIQINEIRKDLGAVEMYQGMVDFAKQQGCHLLDLVASGEAQGICHVLLPEQGFIRPGMIIAGTDSHSCTYGAFGAFSTGVGTTDMANIFATGDLWLRVPATLLFELSGNLPQDISAKDIMLFILSQIGCHGATGKVIEFRGSIIEQLSIDERMTLANMAIEAGAICGLIAPDHKTIEYLQQKSTKKEFNIVTSDPDTEYEQVYQFDLSNLEPQIARPPKPDQVVNISELEEITITKAFIGSCTGGKLNDLAQAAKVLKGHKVASQVSLFVVPASQEVRQQAEKLGYLAIFQQAGAQILKSGCGACINAGIGVLEREEIGIYATNRNFKGRSGDPTGKNYLASPRIVAISAIKGKITNQID